jgi:hypothetical protein
MKSLKQALWIILIVAILGGAATGLINYYSFIFAKVVQGKVMRVERVIDPSAMIAVGGATALPNAQMFSFAVEIQEDKTGLIFTASSEDRQWAVVQQGQCVQAKFFPYPPWNLEKGGTYFNARLLHVNNCN